MIRVVAADDHAIVTAGLRQVFETTPDIRLVGEAVGGEQLLALLATCHADIAVMDLSMPGLAGLPLLQTVLARFPDIRVVVFSMHTDVHAVSQLLDAGALAYVAKAGGIELLVAGIRSAMQGRKFVDPEILGGMVSHRLDQSEKKPLSAREREIFLLLIDGVPVTDIAARLFLSPKTVSTHKSRIMQKLGLASNAELFRFKVDDNQWVVSGGVALL